MQTKGHHKSGWLYLSNLKLIELNNSSNTQHRYIWFLSILKCIEIYSHTFVRQITHFVKVICVPWIHPNGILFDAIFIILWDEEGEEWRKNAIVNWNCLFDLKIGLFRIVAFYFHCDKMWDTLQSIHFFIRVKRKSI